MSLGRCCRFAALVWWVGIGCRALPAAGEQAPRNLAAAAQKTTITASSEVGRLRGKDHRAATVIDGQIGEGYWCTAFQSKPPHWLELRLAGPRSFDTLVLHMYERSTLRSCRVERWDGRAWLPVAEAASKPRPKGDFVPAWEFSDAPSGIVRCRFPAVTADRVRLWFQRDSSIRLYEAELLEASPATAAAPSAPRRLDRQAPLVRLGFGRSADALPPGWLPVTAATRYTPAQGVGWLGEGQRMDCDRGGGAPCAQSFVAGWGSAGRLRVDLPAGRYVAALSASDFMLPVRPFQIEAAGRPLGLPVATISSGAWDVRRFRLEAGPQGLELTLRGDAAWLVNALLIAPESQLDGLLAEADRLEEQLALGSPEWMSKRTLIATPAPAEPAVSATARQRGYVLFSSEPVERVYPYTRPTAQQIDRPVTLQATPGEAAVATLGVVPLRALFNMRLAGSDLLGPGGARMPAAALDLRVVRCWPQIDKTPAGRGKVQSIPELLAAQARQPAVCAPTGATRQYWITVRVPADARAGTYRGQLQFSAEGVAPAAVPVELTVLPFRLQTPSEKTFYTYAILGDLSDEEIRPLLADMRAHGMNALASDLVGKWRRTPEGNVKFDADPLRRVLRLAKEAGLTRPMPWHAEGLLHGIEAPAGSAAWNATVANLLRQVRQVQQEVGGPELLFYPVDEPFGNDERLTLAERALGVARQTHALRSYCTPAEGDIARLGQLLDVRCYAIGSVADVRAAAASSRQAGARFWWYTNAARELPDVRRYLAGVWFWHTGAEGQGYWVYQSRWRRTRPFQDLEGDLHAHDYVAYPDLDGPTPTVQWECMRQGLDDARYLYTLEAALAAHRASPHAATAERFLVELHSGLPQSVKLANGTWTLYDCPWKPADFARLRREAARLIAALLKE